MPFVDTDWKERATEAARIKAERDAAQAALDARNALAAECKALSDALHAIGVEVSFTQADIVAPKAYLSIQYSERRSTGGFYQTSTKLERFLKIDQETAFGVRTAYDGSIHELHLIRTCSKCHVWIDCGTPKTQDELGVALGREVEHGFCESKL